MTYYPRFADKVLDSALNGAGAVLIEGPKSCGKTETAMLRAASMARFDVDADVKIKMDIDPTLLLEGATPRLFDEWQIHPKIWDFTRRAVDSRKRKGQFILTGSATPGDKARLHSGAGRFSVVKMRPMSWFERGWSEGLVGLSTLMRGEAPSSPQVEFSLEGLAEKIIGGGWPGLINGTPDTFARFVQDYVALIAEADVSRVSEKRRDPHKVMRLLRSLARNTASEASLATLSRDTAGDDLALDDETIADYLAVLGRLMVTEDLPAWNAHIRSSALLRKAPKRHFCDPSLAAGALGLSPAKLARDTEYLGMLFESAVIRDLRVYAWVAGATVFHYRDSTGLEADAIVEYPGGEWGAFEAKLGLGAADAAASNLKKLADGINTAKMPPPSTLTVITANGFAHRRPDGVNVVPLGMLTA
jgi:predicted AAA+ superfamily ATPase